MCFNQELSLFFGLVGVGASYYFYKKKYIFASISIFYFSLMEFIQFFQYTVIDQCNNKVNKILTIIGYIHICFQPIFFNLWLFEFTKKRNFSILKLGIVSGLLLLSRLFFVNDKNLCNEKTEPLCGKKICSFSGEKHVAWNLRLRNGGVSWITPSIGLHFFMWAAPVLTLFEIKPLIAFFITLPILAILITKNIHEMPAIWCFTGIAQLLLSFILLT